MIKGMTHLLLLPLRLIVYALILLLPLLAFWMISSLAVLTHGPDWLPWLAGGLAFPILPLLWEFETLFGRLLRDSEDSKPRAGFGFSDRLMLNTFLLNAMFLAGLLGIYPQESFMALSTRGDWMLAGRSDPWAEDMRLQLLRLANGLDSFYAAALENPLGALAAASASFGPSRRPGPSQTGKPGAAGTAWPPSGKRHPALAQMPAAAEKNVATIAAYLAAHEPDPYGRAKAVYDYVSSRIAYDAPALAKGKYPPQDPVTVLRTRKAVCAGYARLFMAIANELGLLTMFVTGDARDLNGMVPPGAGHAWNAVKIRNQWYLLDSTWGSGFINQGKFKQRYSSAYLFTPPEIFGLNHFPDEAKWQLRKQPLSVSQFRQQPSLQADFFARGWRLAATSGSPLQVNGRVELQLQNTGNQYLLAHLKPTKGESALSCHIRGMHAVTVSCPLPAAGDYRLELYSNAHSYGVFESVGEFKVHADKPN